MQMQTTSNHAVADISVGLQLRELIIVISMMNKSDSQANDTLIAFNPVDKNGVRIPSSVYFGGCAWGSAFYVGVYKAMCEVLLTDFVVNQWFVVEVCCIAAMAWLSRSDIGHWG